MADIEIRTDEEFENAQRELSALVEQGRQDDERAVDLQNAVMAYRDRHRGDLEKGLPDESKEEGAPLDESLDETFPASDPPAETSPGHAGKPRGHD